MCIKCNKENFPFYPENVRESDSFNRDFLASENIKWLFKGINDLNDQNITNADTNEEFDLTPIIDCNYFDLESFRIFEENKKKFSLIHLNIASLQKH